MDDYAELKERISMLEAKIRALESHLGIICIYKPESYEIVKEKDMAAVEVKSD